MEGESSSLVCELLLTISSAAIVERRRATFERVEKLTGAWDTKKLPAIYGNMNREDAYEEGLKTGKAAFEDGIRHGHDFFVNITPRCMLANSRFVLPQRSVEPTKSL